MEISNDLNISNLLEDGTLEVDEGMLILPGHFYDGTDWVQAANIEIPAEHVQQPANDSSILLIKIPEDMQASTSFDTLPSIQLKPNIVKEINKASDGYDGVYLTMPSDGLGPPRKSTVNIIRRKPLQIIQTVVPMVKAEPKIEEVKVNKRKQQFNLSREDGIVFLADTPNTPEPQVKRARVDNDEWFATLVPKKTSEFGTKTSVDESNRCHGCNKMFKNLAKHKCKKLGAVEGGKEPMICASCNKTYKSKKGLLNHFKKCDQTKVFEDKPYANSDTDDAMEDYIEEVEAPEAPMQEANSFDDFLPMEISVPEIDAAPETNDLMCYEEMPLDDIIVKEEYKFVQTDVSVDAEAATAAIKAEETVKKAVRINKPKKASKLSKRTVEKTQKGSDPAPKCPPSDQKNVLKLPPIEKPLTRLSTKQIKMLTRSAKKKLV